MKRVLVTVAILGLLGTGLSPGEPPPPSPTPTPTPVVTPTPRSLVLSFTGAITIIKEPKTGSPPIALVPKSRNFGGHKVPDHAIYIGFDPETFLVVNSNRQAFQCIQDHGICIARSAEIGDLKVDVYSKDPATPLPESLGETLILSKLIGDGPDADVLDMEMAIPGNFAARIQLPEGNLRSVCDDQVHVWRIRPVGASSPLTTPLSHTIELHTKHTLVKGDSVAVRINDADGLSFERIGKGRLEQIKFASVEPDSTKNPPKEDHHYLLHYLGFVTVPPSGKVKCKPPKGSQAGDGPCPFPEKLYTGCKPIANETSEMTASGRGSNCPPAVW